MPITLTEIKHQLLKKQELHLYIATNSLWWTHCKADIEKITIPQKEEFKRIHNELVNHEMATQETIDIANYNFVKQMEVPYYDPSGTPIYIAKNAEKFIKKLEEAPYMCGEFGIDAFIKAHNDNCNGFRSVNWSDYNKLVATDKQLSEEEFKAIQKEFNDKMAILHMSRHNILKNQTPRYPQRDKKYNRKPKNKK